MPRAFPLLLLLCAGAITSAAELPHILVLMSYHRGMPWEDGVVTGMQRVLGDKAELVYVHHDVKRFPDRRRVPSLIEATRGLAQSAKPVLVIAVDDYAWDLAVAHRDELFPGLPIVFGGVNFWDGVYRPPRSTGVVESCDPAATVALALRLHPQANRLVVVNDQTETGQANRLLLERELPPVLGNRPITWLGGGTFAETEATLAALDPERDVVLIMAWNLDSTGAVRSYDEAGRRIRSVCPAPVYATWDLYFDKGLVGGYLLDAQVHGLFVGDLAARVLAGEAAETIPVVTRPSFRLSLDQRELDRFHVDPARVPPEAEILHRVPTFWSQHGTTVLIVGVIFLLQAATIAGLVIALRRHRRTAADLAASQGRFLRLLDNSRDIIYRLDLHSGRFEYLSPAFARITGHPVEQAIAEPFIALRIVPPAWHGWLEQQLAAIRRGELAPNYEYPVLRPDGSECWLHHRPVLIRDAQGHPIAMEAVATDITERRQNEERLGHAQRLNAVGQLASGIAHDFNNVLTAVLGHADLLSMQLGDRPGLRHHAETISAAAQRAAGTVRNLLAFARGGADKSGAVEINRLAQEVIALVSRALDRRIELQTGLDPDAGWIRGGADDLQQVLVNLMLNARDAMPNGGRLRVVTQRCRLSDEAAVAWNCAAGDGTVLSVEDNGCGIRPEHLSRIFEPFFTTKGIGKGTGLGLSIVYGTVRGLGGGVQVASTPGRGTAIRLWLPVAPPIERLRTPPPIRIRHLRVLLVDDDPVVLAVVRELLNANGCSVVPFGDPAAAATWFAGHAAEIDAAMLDGNMPNLTGWELAERLRAVHAELPILALTGQATPEAIQAWNTAGVKRILQKPVAREALSRELAAISLPA